MGISKTIVTELAHIKDTFVEKGATGIIAHGACRASLRLPKEKKYETRVFR